MRRVAIALVGVSLSIFSAQADLITVSGNVTGVWRADTVMVVGEITVPTHQMLTIQPGVRVLFTGLYKFIINGRLQAQGTVADSIIFTRAYATEESKWRGFRFDAANSASLLEYCRIEYAKGEGAYPDVRGGAVWMKNCSPTIRHCLIVNNFSHNANANGMGGGICAEDNCHSIIEYNRIAQNVSDSGGGVCGAWASDLVIRHNIIEYNYAYSAGGGIYIGANASATVHNNIIRFNSAAGWGGGGVNLWGATWLYGTFSKLYDNLIYHNTATDAGGGIYTRYETSHLEDNTLIDNQASRGGGLYVITYAYIPPIVRNSILWSNTAALGSQINLETSVGSAATITYCDVQGGWSGVGNLYQNPAFLDTVWHDLRLSWGSPCIDTGDPNSVYNDPDGTRSDMGAGCFDQTWPVQIFLTPHGDPLEIAAGGGTFEYTIQVCNTDNTTHQVTAWCNSILPNGTTHGPLYGPINAFLTPDSTAGKVKSQSLSAASPTGLYHFEAYAVAGADTSRDSFTFVKLGGREENPLAGEDGDLMLHDLDEAPDGNQTAQSSGLRPPAPNPFNAETSIEYEIAHPGLAQLALFNVAGKKVAQLVDGWREAGSHQVTFKSGNLPSGVYVLQFKAGQVVQAEKMVLIK